MSVYSNKSGEDIDSCLHHWSKTHPQKLAIADSQQRLTWQALDRKLNQVANALIQLGLEPNQRLLFWAATVLTMGCCFWVVCVPVSVLCRCHHWHHQRVWRA